jgi:hypothetical protein
MVLLEVFIGSYVYNEFDNTAKYPVCEKMLEMTNLHMYILRRILARHGVWVI